MWVSKETGNKSHDLSERFMSFNRKRHESQMIILVEAKYCKFSNKKPISHWLNNQDKRTSSTNMTLESNRNDRSKLQQMISGIYCHLNYKILAYALLFLFLSNSIQSTRALQSNFLGMLLLLLLFMENLLLIDGFSNYNLHIYYVHLMS